MMASLGNFKTLKISDARKNRRRTISEIENFKNGPVSAVSIYYSLLKNYSETLNMILNRIILIATSQGNQ